MIKKFLNLVLWKKITWGIVTFIILYLVVSLTITLSSLFHMTNQNKHSRNEENGLERLETIKDALGDKNVIFNLYTEDEIKADPSKENVLLYYFPAQCTNTKTTNFSLLVPGGGYTECEASQVCFGAANRLNEMGINCFVMTYRVGEDANGNKPLKDLETALDFILNNSSTFKVNDTNYNVTGFSAGGHLVALFGTMYKELGFTKPASLTLVYPWTNLVRENIISGNIVQDIMDSSMQKKAFKALLGDKYTKEDIETLEINSKVDETYPACYIMQGSNDFVVNHKYNSETFVKALDNNNIEYEYNLVKGINHGCGIGLGLANYGWLDSSVYYWSDNTK